MTVLICKQLISVSLLSSLANSRIKCIRNLNIQKIRHTGVRAEAGESSASLPALIAGLGGVGGASFVGTMPDGAVGTSTDWAGDTVDEPGELIADVLFFLPYLSARMDISSVLNIQ